MVNKPRNKGTREQRRQRQLLEANGFGVTVLAERGIYDEGDLAFELPLFGRIVVECKDRAQIPLHATLAKAQRKAGGDAVVWWKRTEKKDGNERRTQVGRPLVAMDEDLFLALLNELAERSNL